MQFLRTLFLGSLFSSCLAFAQEGQQGQILNVVVPDDFPPFYYQTPDGEMKGASFEIVAQVCEQLGFQLSVTQVANMKTLLADLGSGRQDLAVNLTATPEREKVAAFTSIPHIYETQNLIVRSNSNIEFSGNLEELTDLRFGPIFGWTYGPVFDNAEYLEKVYLNDSVEQLRRLLSGGYDIAVNNPQFFMGLAEEAGVTNAFKVLRPNVYTLPVTIAVSHRYADTEGLIESLNQGVSDFKKTEKYSEILDKYGFGRSSAEGEGEQ